MKRRPSTAPATTQSVVRQPRATIFVLHGIEDDKELGPYVLYREMLVHEGFRVVQVDFRGHGRSTGDLITYGADESRDLVQVLDELEQQGLIAGDVGVVAVSYGAAISVQWAAIDPRVKAIVALEPFCDLYDAAHDAAPIVLGKNRWMFSDRDLRHAVDTGGKLAGFDPAMTSPLRAIASTSTPVLLFHSRADELIPYKHSQRLHDAAPDHSKLILVNGQSHFDMWIKSFDLIRDESLRWFDEYLKK